jgi:hypothetical protein
MGLLAFGLFGCGLTELDEFLVDPSAVSPENSETSLVMNAVQIDFATFIDEVSDETSPYVRLRAMQNSNFYEGQLFPTSLDLMWRIAYADLIPDMDLVIANSDEVGSDRVAGATRVMKAYVLYTLVDIFGDIPFTEINQGTAIISPAADDDQSVYESADAILDAAIANLTDPGGGDFSNDLYYGGDASKWLSLANTLKIRRAVQTRLVSDAAATINGILGGGAFMDVAGEDFQWEYGTSEANPDARAPQYSANYINGAAGYQSNYYMWLFFGEKQTVDPRLRYYFYRQDCDETDENNFTLDCPRQPYPAHWPNGFPFCTASGDFGDPTDIFGGYWGRDHGDDSGIPPDADKRTVWGVYPFGGKFDADDCSDVLNNGVDGGRGAGIQPIMLSSYTHFLLAEADLTVGIDGEARAYLEAGVRQSIEKAISFSSVSTVDEAFVPSNNNINGYVEEVLELYDAADDDGKLDVIVKEFFLALHGQGLDAYNAYRRTGKPDSMQPTELEGPGAFPRTFWYPANYVERNQRATQRQGLATQVFWDTNPAGFIN